jgi:hypothetical protein
MGETSIPTNQQSTHGERNKHSLSSQQVIRNKRLLLSQQAYTKGNEAISTNKRVLNRNNAQSGGFVVRRFDPITTVSNQ